MKTILYILTAISICSQNLFSQDTGYSTLPIRTVLEVKRPQVIYRGIMNNVSIVVPDAVKTDVSGEGVVLLDSVGHYYIKPGVGKETAIDIKATMPDGSLYRETRYLPIKNVPQAAITVDGRDRIIDISKKDLEKVTIGYAIPGVLTVEIAFFTFQLKNKKHYTVEGNKFDDTSLKILRKLHKGDVFSIIYAKNKEVYPEGFCGFILLPVKILIID